jgi:hypothetical protein
VVGPPSQQETGRGRPNSTTGAPEPHWGSLPQVPHRSYGDIYIYIYIFVISRAEGGKPHEFFVNVSVL